MERTLCYLEVRDIYVPPPYFPWQFFALEVLCNELSGLQLATRLFDALCYVGKTCPSNLVYWTFH